MANRLEVSYLPVFREYLKNKVLGVTFSCWDLLHPGHLLFLEDCKSKCDILVVGLQTDPTIDRPEKNQPIQSLEEREIAVRSCRYVDYYFVYNTEKSLYDSIIALSPDIRFLGDDYVGKRFTGDNLPVQISYHQRSAHTFSTTSLRKRIYEAEKKKLAL